MSRIVLTVNVGSSSIKLALFDAAEAVPQPLIRARLETGTRTRRLQVIDRTGTRSEGPALQLGRRTSVRGVATVLDWFEARLKTPIGAVGHRIVHGGADVRPAVEATDAALRSARDLAPLAPLHQAQGIATVEAVGRARPRLRQALVFDTAFHRGHDPVVDRLGLPRAWEDRGLRRFGFHGLSYEYIAGRLQELDPSVAVGRVIAAHLGSGASLCALRDGRSVDTTMGATPLDGLLMGTRCGSIDPGVILYLTQGLDGSQLSDLLYRKSGLLGVSGLSADMRVLLQSHEASAREAIELFVFRIAREAAALAGTLGGVDGIVFTAGIGENCPKVRAAVCERLAWLGVQLDDAANKRGEAKISVPGSGVAVWVIPANEEQMIAIHTREAMALAPSGHALSGKPALETPP